VYLFGVKNIDNIFYKLGKKLSKFDSINPELHLFWDGGSTTQRCTVRAGASLSLHSVLDNGNKLAASAS